MGAEGVLFALLLCTALVGLTTAIRNVRLRTRIMALTLLLSAASVWAAVHYRVEPVLEADVRGRPIQVLDEGYVSSIKCRACHAREYDAWYGSYHRTMTQVATTSTALGDFDGRVLELFGRTYELEQRGDELWVEMDDQRSQPPGAHRTEKQISLVTGSHNMQVYWFPIGDDRNLGQFPFVHLVSEQRWIPRGSAFLMPPRGQAAWEVGRWNTTCVKCHTTFGRPRVGELPLNDYPELDTHVGEFGIACESCHGPGDEHVRQNRNPRRRYGMHWSDAEDSTIVNPEHLSHRRSSEVCGQCHSVFVFHDADDMQQYFAHGFPYRPGDELARTRKMPGHGETTFWPDGTIRVAGREYSALEDSACFQDGEISCLSCHSMHKSKDDPRSLSEWASGQLKVGMAGNEACLQCHDKFREDLQRHTFHDATSTGSLCYNCHMPYTTYGLLKGIRRHTIGSPTVEESTKWGRPNACNQCHLNETLGWTADNLKEWYGTPSPDLFGEERAIATSVLWALKGDAAQRALAAWSMGWDDAIAVSGSDWMAPYLAQLLEDPYDVVRFIAARSLRKHPGFAEFEFDFVTSPAYLAEARGRAYATWAERTGTGDRTEGPGVLIRPGGHLETEMFAELLRQRNDAPIYLAE